MKSDKVEYIRFDDLSTGILMGNKPYILAHGDFNSLQEVRTPMGQVELLEQLGKQLRYDASETGLPSEKLEAIKKCSDEIHRLCIDFEKLPEDVGHLEIYLNPSELALVPFELLLNDTGEPRFVGKNGRQLVLTRNFRRDNYAYIEIPKKPRVLFVHTKPRHKNFLGLPFPDLQYKNHLQSLRYALRNYDLEDHLTVLSNPTFEEFTKAVFQAEEKENPFTHIHILGHGSLLFDHKNPSDFEYGIAFHSKIPLENPYRPIPTQEIKAFFESLKSLPYLVNYMICDSANFTNGTKPDKNPVQATFKVGVPIVLGSQFPLSMNASNTITKALYKRLFRGGDIRSILGDIRTQLYAAEPKDQHDWISLVSYVDLPEDYEYQLLLVQLESQLAILNSIRTNAPSKDNETAPTKDDFIRAKVQLEQSISELSTQAIAIAHDKSREAAFLENAGLLGSAYKRLAEVEHQEALVLGSNTQGKQNAHLREAKKWYKMAADRNLSHHWCLVQYISLCSILDGGLVKNETDYWNTARLAALTEIKLNDAKHKKSVWPHGTLIELYLLTTNNDMAALKDTILGHTEKLVTNTRTRAIPEAIASTKFQLARYLDWWGSGKFELPKGILAQDGEFLILVLQRLDQYAEEDPDS